MKNLYLRKILITFLVSSIGFNSSLLATDTTTSTTTTDQTNISAQKSACAANSASVWNTTLNRCMNKVEEANYRKSSSTCNALTTLSEREACQLALANQTANLSSSAEDSMSKLSSGTTRSAVINGANTIISAINMLASSNDSSKNTCTCKQILAATAFAGTVTDILMKIKMKKSSDDLVKKFEILTTDNAYTAQYKALEYLKEGQKTVKEIADWEVKRQTLLMIGYGAAIAAAAYEGIWNHSTCTGDTPAASNPKQVAEAAAPAAAPAAPAAAENPAPAAAPSAAAETPVVTEAAVAKEPAPAAVTTAATPAATTTPDPTIQYSKDGKTVYMTQTDSSGQVVGVYHGGKDGAVTYYSGSDIVQTKALDSNGKSIWVVKSGATGTSTGSSQLSFFKTRTKKG
jgi:hypothetical protein